MTPFNCWLAVGALSLALFSSQAQQLVSTSEDVKGVSITVYNQNFAVVREKRTVALPDGTASVRYEDVASTIDPTSISFKSLTNPNGVAVREQNYQYDLLSPAAILNKSLGKQVEFRHVKPDGKSHYTRGTLLNLPYQEHPNGSNYAGQWHGVVLKKQDGSIVLNPWGQQSVNELPEGLIAKPSLLWQLLVDDGGEHETEISYIANQLNWVADFVAIVNDEETAVDLTGWVTLDNRTGATYANAQLQLMAGDVRRVEEQNEYRDEELYYAMDAVAEAPAPQFEEESFFEYHLYTLEGRTTLQSNETKQMTLLTAADAGVERKLVFDSRRMGYFNYNPQPGTGTSTQDIKAAIMVELENSEENNMGMPLPKGKVRMYKEDPRGNLQFIGEDLIDHTPKNETIRLYIGEAFDVVAERKRTDYKRISTHVHEEEYEINVRNHKDEAASVVVTEHMSYGEWHILTNSHRYEKTDATTLDFALRVPADSELTVKYRVRYNY